MIHLFFLLVASAFCLELGINTSYSGLRVIKNCKSIMKDNIKLMADISFNDLAIADMSETQGEWLNKETLTLKNFKVTSSDGFSKFKNTPCSVTSTGTFQAINNKESFDMLLSFSWVLENGLGSDNGEATVKMSSREFNLMQNYYGSPSTTFFIGWKEPNIDFKSDVDKKTAAWCLKLITERLDSNINLEMNKRLERIGDEIIKSYRNITIDMKDDKSAVIAINTVDNPVGVKFKEEYYVVLNYKTLFNNSKYSYTTKYSLDTPFAEENESFDFKFCFNSRFFGEFITFRSLFRGANEVFLNNINLEDYPTRIGFYKSIVPSLTNQYTDDRVVEIDFRGDKEVTYPSSDHYRIPTKCTFTVKNEKIPFLTLSTEYNVLHVSQPDAKEGKIQLRNATIAHFDTEPEVDYQAQIVAMELANSLGELINEFTIPKGDGLVVDNLRSGDYERVEGKVNSDETCVLFKEKVKVSH